MTIERRQAAPCGEVAVALMVIAVARLVNFEHCLPAVTAKRRRMMQIGFIALMDCASAEGATFLAVN